MSISTYYVVSDSGPPADGPHLASTSGWLDWADAVLARGDEFPEAAHLAAHGWSDRFEDLEHDLEGLLHAGLDADATAVTAQVLAAARARPDGALELRASDGEPADDEGAEDTIGKAFDPNEPRDDAGKWATSGSGGSMTHHADHEEAGADYGQKEPNPALGHEARPRLTAKEVRAVQEYVGEDSDYADVNAHLRGGGKLFVTTLQDAINKAGTLPEPVVVGRGLRFEDDDAREEFLAELEAARTADQTWTERGFVSTSTQKGFAGEVQIEILARRGLDASYYAYNSGEMLLPAGSEFRVLAVNRSGAKTRVKLEQVVS